MLFAEGKIKQIAIGLNLPETATITLLNGVPDDVYNSIAKAKELEEWSEENFMAVSVFLEGYAYGGSATSSADLRDIENLSAEGVTLVIGQDYDVAAKKLATLRNMPILGLYWECAPHVPLIRILGKMKQRTLPMGLKIIS